MEWLTNNPIADMPGPEFLFVFGVLTALTIIFIKLKARRLDPTLEDNLPPLPIPGKLSPIEVALLSGDHSKTLGTVIFSLWNRGYLRVETPEKGRPYLTKAETYPDIEELTPIERAIFVPFRNPNSNRASDSVAAHLATIKRFGKDLEPALHDELILMPDESRQSARQLFWQAAPWLVMVGGYKLVIALDKGKHNVWFLVGLIFVGILGLAIATTLPRLTRRGKEFLDQMKLAFRDVPASSSYSLAADGYPADEKAVLGVALFGLMALKGPPLAAAWQWFAPATAVSGGSVATGAASCGGGGAGGGGCGGGGCGGGCGGCGGG